MKLIQDGRQAKYTQALSLLMLLLGACNEKPLSNSVPAKENKAPASNSVEGITREMLTIETNPQVLPYAVEPLGPDWKEKGWSDERFMIDVGRHLASKGLNAKNALAYDEVTDRHLIVKVLPLHQNPETPFHIEVSFNRFLEVSTGGQTLEHPVAAWQAAGIDEGTQENALEGILQLLDLFLSEYFAANGLLKGEAKE